MPRAELARGRFGTEADDGIHRLIDRQDRACALRSVAAEVDRAMKRLRVLVLLHPDLIPPESSAGYTEQEINVWKTEYDVVSTLRAAGHEVRPLGVHDELKPIRDEIDSWKPDIAFSLLEQFQGEVIYDQNVVSYLELMRIPYTGCNPPCLLFARCMELPKALVPFHPILVPKFSASTKLLNLPRPAHLALPLTVKSVRDYSFCGMS